MSEQDMAARDERQRLAMAHFLALSEKESQENGEIVSSTTQGPPAGWYPHPTMTGTQRYWDGQGWTEHIAPGVPAGYAQPQSATPEDHTGLIVAGILTAIIIPFIGFIIGIVLMTKDRIGPGLGCIIISVIAFFVWLSALTPTQTTGY